MMKEEVSDDPFMSVLEAWAAEMIPDFENVIVAQKFEPMQCRFQAYY